MPKKKRRYRKTGINPKYKENPKEYQRLYHIKIRKPEALREKRRRKRGKKKK